MDEKMEETGLLKPPFAHRPIPPVPIQSQNSSSPAFQAHLQNGEISPQPLLDSPANVPLSPLDSLPTITGRGSEDIYLANDDIAKFLHDDLDLERLNRIHGHLWMAGRPMRARPLHRYQMMGFNVLHTQQMDLHLLKFSTRLMIKPLSEYMLSHDFWAQWICNDSTLHKNACGFLLSYVWLVTTPLDLKLAHDHFLIPSFITWHWWKAFVKDFVSYIDPNSLDQVNERFHFGDLRLGRINSIYRTRFAFTHFVRGYLYGYNRYVVFFQRNFSWILIVFVFFSLVLAAMQVGASVDPLQDNNAFLKSCYVFVVFSMVSVAAVLACVAFIFVVIFFFNMVAAISHAKQKRFERLKKGEARRSKKTV